VEADRGLEFEGDCRRWVESEGMTFIQLVNKHKASLVERLIRTIKTRMTKAMAHRGNNKWLDLLQPVMLAYNTSYHRSIKRAPNDITRENEEEIYQELHPPAKQTTPKYKIGDLVRKQLRKSIVEKSYSQTYSSEKYIIAEVTNNDRPSYKITNEDGNYIKGTFYEFELTPAGAETGHT
jgi:hypothetical protein